MPQDATEQTIPLFQEQVHVTKTDFVSDHVRVSTSVQERSVLIEEDLLRGAIQVERVPVDFMVSDAPPPRQDGETLIVSVVEERAIVEKRLFVVEELRITRTSTTEHVAIPVTIRTMQAAVEHTQPAPPTGRTIDG